MELNWTILSFVWHCLVKVGRYHSKLNTPLKGLLGQKSKLIFWAPDIKTMKLHLQSPNIHLVFQISNYGNVNALKKRGNKSNMSMSK